MSTKGITLEPGTVVVLSLDGTLVYVESVQPQFIAVVALPDQPTPRSDDRIFTPGRVGAKKVSPFATASAVVPVADLSDRNRTFIGTYERLREEHGPNHVDRTPEELAAQAQATQARPAKARKARMTPEERAAAKATKRAERDAAKQQAKADKAAAKTAPTASTPRAPKAAKPGRPPKGRALADDARLAWCGDETKLDVLAAVNPKYKANNSGRAIASAFEAAGTDGLTVLELQTRLVDHPKWSQINLERLRFAVAQLRDAGLVK